VQEGRQKRGCREVLTGCVACIATIAVSVALTGIARWSRRSAKMSGVVV